MAEVPEQYAHARFVSSVARLAQLPEDGAVEVAFAGRSNAGKSSALNVIAGQRGLARISKTPGRTRLINLFEIGAGRRLVDLPGYGYAKVPESTRRDWEVLLAGYLERRRTLAGVILVLDARRGVTDLDRRLLELITPNRVGVHVLLTKADKLGRGASAHALDEARRALEQLGVEATLQLFSATRRTGLEDVHGILDTWFAGGADGT